MAAQASDPQKNHKLVSLTEFLKQCQQDGVAVPILTPTDAVRKAQQLAGAYKSREKETRQGSELMLQQMRGQLEAAREVCGRLPCSLTASRPCPRTVCGLPPPSPTAYWSSHWLPRHCFAEA